MNFHEISKSPRNLLAMTGYTLDEFTGLLPSFKKSLSESKYTLEGKERKNQSTDYKSSVFSDSSDKLFFILVYLKQNPTQSMQGLSFGITQSKANQWIHFLTPILNATLAKLNMLPSRDMNEISKREASLFSHDGTERPIQRPKDSQDQKKYYSGKKSPYRQE